MSHVSGVGGALVTACAAAEVSTTTGSMLNSTNSGGVVSLCPCCSKVTGKPAAVRRVVMIASFAPLSGG